PDRGALPDLVERERGIRLGAAAGPHGGAPAARGRGGRGPRGAERPGGARGRGRRGAGDQDVRWFEQKEGVDAVAGERVGKAGGRRVRPRSDDGGGGGGGRRPPRTSLGGCRG